LFKYSKQRLYLMEVCKKEITHLACGKRHVDTSYYATFAHQKHLCEHCHKYFYDKEKAVGV